MRTCQSSTQALCGVDNNLNISCHNSHRLYWHVYTCKHQLQPKSTSFVLCLCTYTPKSNHLWTCTYMSAFVPSTMGTCQSSTLCLVDNNLNYVSALASTQVIVCTSITSMSKHIYYKVSVLRACLHVTYIPSLPSILACAYMSIVNPSRMRCRQ